MGSPLHSQRNNMRIATKQKERLNFTLSQYHTLDTPRHAGNFRSRGTSSLAKEKDTPRDGDFRCKEDAIGCNAAWKNGCKEIEVALQLFVTPGQVLAAAESAFRSQSAFHIRKCFL